VNLEPLALSLKVACAATLLAVLLGVSFAAVLSRRRLPLADLLDVLVTAPLVLPPTVLGYYLLVAFGRRSAIGEAFESVTGSPVVFTVYGAVLAATIGALPLVVMSSRAALLSVDHTLVAAARTLGAGPLRSFLTIELPMATPGIAAGTMLGFARALGDFGVTLMVAGNIPGETQTASLAIYDAIQAGREGEALGTVVALTLSAVTLLFVARKLTRRRGGGV